MDEEYEKKGGSSWKRMKRKGSKRKRRRVERRSKVRMGLKMMEEMRIRRKEKIE